MIEQLRSRHSSSSSLQAAFGPGCRILDPEWWADDDATQMMPAWSAAKEQDLVVIDRSWASAGIGMRVCKFDSLKVIEAEPRNPGCNPRNL
jgi:hypothetical protein